VRAVSGRTAPAIRASNATPVSGIRRRPSHIIHGMRVAGLDDGRDAATDSSVDGRHGSHHRNIVHRHYRRSATARLVMPQYAVIDVENVRVARQQAEDRNVHLRLLEDPGPSGYPLVRVMGREENVQALLNDWGYDE
jgi:hypothetical protein